MNKLVSTSWVEERLGATDFVVLDPRRPTHYLQGHLRKAVNLPVTQAFDAHSRLLSDEALARWAGAAGVGDDETPVIYDAHDGRNGAMLAWILEYMGRTDVHLMDSFLGGWLAEKREVFYRPIKPAPVTFTARPNPEIRACLDDLQKDKVRLLDLRSADEYAGKVTLLDDRPGHIPGAIHIAWSDLLGENNNYLAMEAEVRARLSAVGIGADEKVIAYCRTGVRAAVGYLALKQAGVNVVLYDGSYAEWSRSGRDAEKQGGL